MSPQTANGEKLTPLYNYVCCCSYIQHSATSTLQTLICLICSSMLLKMQTLWPTKNSYILLD